LVTAQLIGEPVGHPEISQEYWGHGKTNTRIRDG